MHWTRLSAPPPALSLDQAQGRLSIDGEEIRLSPLLFNLLAALVATPGHLVSRRELKRVLWPYAERIDTERRLNTAMRALRAALNDDPDRPRFIETVRGRGYRWIGHAHDARRPTLAGRAASLMLVALGLYWLVPQATYHSDIASLLKAQAAVDEWRLSPTEAGFRQASASIETAARRNRGPAVHLLRGNLALEGRWDWTAAAREFNLALAIDPDNADARLALAWLHANRGDHGTALGLAGDMAASSALSEDRRANLGWLLIRLNRPALAADVCAVRGRAGINTLSCAHIAMAMTGRIDRARDLGVSVMRKLGASAPRISEVQKLPAREGYQRFLDWRVRHFLPEDAPWFQKAQILADAGQTDEALAELARSVAAREPSAVKIQSTPSFAQMRDDPRFRALVKKVGLTA